MLTSTRDNWGCPPARHDLAMARLSLVLVLCAVVTSTAQAQAQAPSQPSGVISGIISTQGGTVRLPGATVTITSGRDVAGETLLSDENGHFTKPLPPGEYTVTAALIGFVTTSVVVRVSAGAEV